MKYICIAIALLLATPSYCQLTVDKVIGIGYKTVNPVVAPGVWDTRFVFNTTTDELRFYSTLDNQWKSADFHPAASIDGLSNPALSSSGVGTQLFKLDLNQSGSYNNSSSGLSAMSIQAAIDENANNINGVESDYSAFRKEGTPEKCDNMTDHIERQGRTDWSDGNSDRIIIDPNNATKLFVNNTLTVSDVAGGSGARVDLFPDGQSNNTFYLQSNGNDASKYAMFVKNSDADNLMYLSGNGQLRLFRGEIESNKIGGAFNVSPTGTSIAQYGMIRRYNLWMAAFRSENDLVNSTHVHIELDCPMTTAKRTLLHFEGYNWSTGAVLDFKIGKGSSASNTSISNFSDANYGISFYTSSNGNLTVKIDRSAITITERMFMISLSEINISGSYRTNVINAVTNDGTNL